DATTPVASRIASPPWANASRSRTTTSRLRSSSACRRCQTRGDSRGLDGLRILRPVSSRLAPRPDSVSAEPDDLGLGRRTDAPYFESVRAATDVAAWL